MTPPFYSFIASPIFGTLKRKMSHLVTGVTLVIAVVAAVTVQTSLPAQALSVDVQNFTLKNGMQVLVIPDHRAPVVTHMVWYRVGSADEPQGEAGIAHFLEHLMFKGTKDVPKGQFSKIISQNGGQDNAFTSKDFTAYFQRIAKDRLELVMKMEADRMLNLQLQEGDVLPERAVVLEERRMRIDNDPSSLLGEQMGALLYLSHPYRKPVIGWMPEVSKLTRKQAVDFYHAHYTPKNAILIVAGDVEAKNVEVLAEKYYGGLKNTFEPGERVRTKEIAPIAARRVTLRDKRVSVPTVRRNYLVPSHNTAVAGESEALEVLAEILGSGTTSRLYQALVVKDKIAAQATAWYSPDALDNGEFGVFAAPTTGHTPEQVETAMGQVLGDVIKKGVSQQELDDARNSLIADTVYALDSQFRLAYLFGSALTSGGSVTDVTGWTGRIEKVTAEQVQAVAKKYLESNRSVTGYLLPQKKAAAK